MKQKTLFRGIATALATPMTSSGAIDYDAYGRLIDWQIESGVAGLVTCGTTGEASTMTAEEHRKTIAFAVKRAAGRVPVIAGTGANCTEKAVELTRFACAAGADACLVVTPYYNKPTQKGLIAHYAAIAESVKLPIVIYNIPGRSVVDMSVETMARLAKHPNIVGVKDATANLARPLHTRAACGPDFCQLSGEDHTAVAFLAAGGHGCISVTANVAPRLCREMHDAWAEGRVAEAIAIQDRLLPVHDAMFCETSPGPVKHAASLLGYGSDHCRLPLAPIAEASRGRVREAMVAAGLLN